MSYTLEIYMKSRNVIKVTVSTWKWERKGGSSSLSWTTPEGRGVRRLVTVDVNEIEAIVEIQ